MYVMITGFTIPDRAIHCIKGLRAASGLGLKESKYVFDTVRDTGIPQRLEIMGDEITALGILSEFGILFMTPLQEAVADMTTRMGIVQDFLYECPRDITIQQALDVLSTFKSFS